MYQFPLNTLPRRARSIRRVADVLFSRSKNFTLHRKPQKRLSASSFFFKTYVLDRTFHQHSTAEKCVITCERHTARAATKRKRSSPSSTRRGLGEVMEATKGSCFGHLALLYDAPRAATCTAVPGKFYRERERTPNREARDS